MNRLDTGISLLNSRNSMRVQNPGRRRDVNHENSRGRGSVRSGDCNVTVEAKDDEDEVQIVSPSSVAQVVWQCVAMGFKSLLKKSVSKEKNGKTIVDGIIRELIQDSGKVFKNLDRILDSKIHAQTLLLDNPTRQGKALYRARKRIAQNIANRSKKHISRRQHKIIGSFDVPFQYRKFKLFQPMHELWRVYALEIVNDSRGKMIEPSLLQLDLHGAYLAVVQAKIDNQVGVEGIMIRETTNTVTIVTKEDKIKVIPKRGSVFVFRLDDMRVAINGDQMPGSKMRVM
ncbi:hypothetical protein KP509_20G048100 [Ceratopteris richardii]|uniref:Uncharacterized protein n=1 Tax=Ceratopteris richardii TaxID=49495 RepID=A0A8T2SI66_CERRI|nr:hypothetical protein KP509_20G048100 [Ceratopteris richardii]